METDTLSEEAVGMEIKKIVKNFKHKNRVIELTSINLSLRFNKYQIFSFSLLR